MLTDAKVRSSKPAERPFKLQDGGGLHLFVSPTGLKSWRWRYQRSGRERLLVIGAYPEMTLRQAREARDDLRQQLRKGGPTAAPPSPPLADVVHRWHAINAPRWKPHHAAEVLSGLDREILGAIGGTPIREITAPMVLTELRKLESRGAIDTAHRIRGRLAEAFAFAIGEGLIEVNLPDAIRGAMAPMPKPGHRPAVLDLAAARDVLAKAEATPARPGTRLALRLLALTAVRPGEVGGAKWTEFEGGTWRIPAQRMKAGREHLVPLSRQAMETLDAARTLSGRMPFVFPSAISARKPMSDGALGVFLRRAGLAGRQVPHGWRATFSTVMNERLPADRLVIDLMLAHAPAEAKGTVEAAYNRASHLARRRELAQLWADLLTEGLMPGLDLIDLPRRSRS